ncbi:MAG TPA: PIN domain nuclease [Spirochaetaceae bacterium]|nr:PIN domain nuclease [Spirochaetaceae bacterium]
MKSIIDANVILRYILDDNAEMAEEAARVIQYGAKTLPEVIAEVVYVLAKVYQATRTDIAAYVRDVLDEVELERSDIMLLAIKIFSETRLDFVDCVLIAYHQIDGVAVFSFDKKLTRLLG